VGSCQANGGAAGQRGRARHAIRRRAGARRLGVLHIAQRGPEPGRAHRIRKEHCWASNAIRMCRKW
jgi:hypothetical protein